MEQPLEVPELSACAGFVLRPWRLSDLPLVRKASEDDYIPLITTAPSPYSDSAGVAFIERQWGRATTRAEYTFVIATSAGRPVGQVGLWLRDLEQGRASLGYWVVKAARGQGAAVAAVDAVVGWALRDLRIPRLELWVEWSRGTRPPCELPSARGSNARDRCRDGSRSGTNAGTCSCIRC